MDAVTKLSYAVFHYCSHRLCANVQFTAVEKNVQAMRTYPSIIYMVPDHKKRFVDEISGGEG